MAPFITQVLELPQNFMVHTMGLLLRSRLDNVKSRTVERGVLQLQALVDQYNVVDEAEGGAGAAERLAWFWELPTPTCWAMKKELAERFISVGMLRSGQQLFDELNMWEEVISCHQMMDDEQKVRGGDPPSPPPLPSDPYIHDIHGRPNDSCENAWKSNPTPQSYCASSAT